MACALTACLLQELLCLGQLLVSSCSKALRRGQHEYVRAHTRNGSSVTLGRAISCSSCVQELPILSCSRLFEFQRACLRQESTDVTAIKRRKGSGVSHTNQG